MINHNPNLHLFIRLDAKNNPVPGSDVLLPISKKPSSGKWLDITECASLCCTSSTTTTTTTT